MSEIKYHMIQMKIVLVRIIIKMNKILRNNEKERLNLVSTYINARKNEANVLVCDFGFISNGTFDSKSCNALILIENSITDGSSLS